VAQAIQSDPTSRLDGKFVRTASRRYPQVGYTEARYVAEQRRVSLRRQLTGTVAAGVEVPKTQLDALVRFQNEQRSVDYLRLTAAQAGTIETPSPETLAAYFEERKQLFRAPEYRKIAILTLTPDDIAKTITVSDDDARKMFEQRRERFVTPERRQVYQLAFPSLEEAKAARARIAAGTSFEDIAKELGRTPADIDIGMVTRAAIADAAIAETAFTLAPDTVSEPVKGALVTALIKVTKVEPGTTPSFESLAPALKREVALERARVQLQDIHNKIEDERGGGANIAEAAQKLGLKAVTIEAVDRSGRGLDGKPVAGLPQGIDIVSQAFTSNVGVENDPVQVNGGDCGSTCSASRRRASARSTRSRTRSRRAGATSRFRPAARQGPPTSSASSTRARRSRPRRPPPASRSRPRRRSSATPTPRPRPSAGRKRLRTPKDGTAGRGSGRCRVIVFKVTDIIVPPADLASDDDKKLKENLQRAQAEEQIAEIRHHLPIGDRRHHQPAGLRGGDRRGGRATMTGSRS